VHTPDRAGPSGPFAIACVLEKRRTSATWALPKCETHTPAVTRTKAESKAKAKGKGKGKERGRGRAKGKGKGRGRGKTLLREKVQAIGSWPWRDYSLTETAGAAVRTNTVKEIGLQRCSNTTVLDECPGRVPGPHRSSRNG
jgi:hypothetical protein